MQTREIWAGDNLEMLASIEPESVDLVYMDPPFASNRQYDAVLSYTRHDGSERVAAFDDRWIEGRGTTVASARLTEYIKFLRSSGQTAMANYIAMMVPRIAESHRVLTERGSIYLHCDATASHYLKLAMDLIMGPENFRNEIVWKRTHAHSGSKRFGPVHDVILYYSKSPKYIWNPAFTEYEPSYLEKHFRQRDDRGAYQLITCTAPGDRTGTRAHYEWKGKLPPPGRHWAWKIEKMVDLEERGLLVHSANGVPRMKRYTDDGAGVALQDVWADIKRLDPHSEERTGYDTQKPVDLLLRIISASTHRDSVVVDPFGGSGTTAVAAEKLGRGWITADESLLAASFTLARARQEAGRASIALHGFPRTVSSANILRSSDSQTFGVWGTGMLSTLISRKDFLPNLATGSGRVQIASRSIDVLAFVPLSAESQTIEAPRKRKRLPSQAIVLGDGAASDGVARSVRERMPSLPVSIVPIECLVAPQSQAHGIAMGVAEALERNVS